MAFSFVAKGFNGKHPDVLTDTDPITAFSAGLLVGVGALLIIAWLFRRRWAEADMARRRIEAVAVKAREILAGSPDGLFIWDRASGGITCSRKLASLLALADGTKARFEDVTARFDQDSARRLAASVKFLHEEGRRFEIVLTTADSAGRRLIQAVGTRAQDRDGQVLADLLWMRDISAAAKLLVDLSGETDLPEARDLHLRGLLDALPFPIWLRDADLKVVFTNQAALSQRIAGPDDAQAETARDEARPVTRNHEMEKAGDRVVISVTECPLEASQDSEGDDADPVGGLIGYAFPKQDGLDPAPAPAPEPADPPPPPAVTDAVLAGLATGIAIFDGATRLQFHNAAFREMWRLDNGWLDDGRDFGEILEHLRAERRLPEVPDFRAYKMEQLQLFDSAQDSAGDPMGDLMHLPDGRTLRAVTHGLPGGGLAFSYDDVTDQLDLESAVNARDAVHRATLEHLTEAVCVFGSDGRLKLFNQAFMQLWGLEAAALCPEIHVTDFIDAVQDMIDADGDWDARKTQIHTAMTAREPGLRELPVPGGDVIEYANRPLPDGGVLVSFRRTIGA
ncbi:MAG: PAS-domain containing protein [Rhodospirillaceae bacterium]